VENTEQTYKTLIKITYMNGSILTKKDFREVGEVHDWYASGMRRKTPMVEYTYTDGGGEIISLANVLRINITVIKGV
jgi:hypothetical protein